MRMGHSHPHGAYLCCSRLRLDVPLLVKFTYEHRSGRVHAHASVALEHKGSPSKCPLSLGSDHQTSREGEGTHRRYQSALTFTPSPLIGLAPSAGPWRPSDGIDYRSEFSLFPRLPGPHFPYRARWPGAKASVDRRKLNPMPSLRALPPPSAKPPKLPSAVAPLSLPQTQRARTPDALEENS